MKGEKWPSPGYVDPCARSANQRPEQLFGFDTLTGEICPKPGLGRTRKARAKRMIADLRLNERHHLRKRRWWICFLSEILSAREPDDPRLRNLVERAASRRAPLSSLTRALLTQMGQLW